MIQTLVPGRRDLGKFLYLCFSLSAGSGRVEGIDCLVSMWGPAPRGGLQRLQPGGAGRGLRGLAWQLWAAPRPVREE